MAINIGKSYMAIPEADVVAFPAAVAAAFAADSVLNWTGGDVTLTTPIVLQATTVKTGFGIRGNGAKILCNFNDATKYALTIEVPVVNGSVLTGISVRNIVLSDLNFRGASAYKGAVEMRCLTNQSWIYSFMMSDISCDSHSDYAYRWSGSVFECAGHRLKSTGGKGGLWAEKQDYNGNNDFGLPSAMELYTPNFRDGSEYGICLAGPAYQEAFDMSIRGGYIVSMGGFGIIAGSGITLVDGVGFENINGGAGMLIGYRGGVIKGGTRGANPIADASMQVPRKGMEFLVYCWGLSGSLVLEDIGFENEGSGSNMKLAYADTGGIVYMNRCGDTISGSGPTVIVTPTVP